jgi:hypothetical protein
MKKTVDKIPFYRLGWNKCLFPFFIKSFTKGNVSVSPQLVQTHEPNKYNV